MQLHNQGCLYDPHVRARALSKKIFHLDCVLEKVHQHVYTWINTKLVLCAKVQNCIYLLWINQFTWFGRALIPKYETKSNNLITSILSCSSLRLFMFITPSPYDPFFCKTSGRAVNRLNSRRWHGMRFATLQTTLDFTCNTSLTKSLKNKMVRDKTKTCITHIFGPVSAPENACMLARRTRMIHHSNPTN